MKCLVTGGSGYLGSSLIEFLSKEFNQITNFDVSPNKKSNINFFQGDIKNIVDINKATKNIDIIYHCIAKVPVTKNKKEFYLINNLGTENLLKAAIENNVKKVIYISSSAVFGIPSNLPIRENDDRIAVEEYGKSKIEAENLCIEYMKKGLDITIIRPRTILGETRLGIFGLLFEWIENNNNIPVLNNGKNFYQFIDIRDLNEAIYLASISKGSNIFNIGAEKFSSIYELLSNLINTVKSTSNIKNLEKNLIFKMLFLISKSNLIPLQEYHFKVYGESVFFDISKAKKVLNWQPKYSCDQSILDSYNAYINIKKSDKLNEGGSPHNSLLKRGLLKYAHYFF